MKSDPVLLGLASAPKKKPISMPPSLDGDSGSDPAAPPPAPLKKPIGAGPAQDDNDDTAEAHQQLDTILKGDPQVAAAVAMLIDALGGGKADAAEDANEPQDAGDEGGM